MKFRVILLFAFCLLLGLSMIVLAKMSNGQRLYVSPKVLDDYRITIEGELKEIENLEALIADTQDKLDEYNEKAAANEDITQELERKLFSELETFGMASGAVSTQGPGVEVLIDDGTRDLEYWENPNDILVHDSDLLLIINELKAAGAEMISVNGQRLVDGSSISCSGYTVRINGQFYARPFIIRAIGDGSRMSAALIGPGGYGTLLKDWGLVFKVTIKDDIVIPEYAEDRIYKYMSIASAETLKEGEIN